MIRLLLDQGLPATTSNFLSDDHWDLVHVSSIGLSRASDLQIIGEARKQNRICITLDADFHALIALAGDATPSIIRLRIEGLNANDTARVLQDIWPQIDEAVHTGALVTVTEKNVRVRRLPLR